MLFVFELTSIKFTLTLFLSYKCLYFFLYMLMINIALNLF